MIIPNGTIQIRSKAVSEIDPETGHSRKPSEASWGEPIPCQYVPTKYNALGIPSGEHATLASYQVYLDETALTPDRIRLTDRNGKAVGDFSVIWVERLDAVCQVRLWI